MSGHPAMWQVSPGEAKPLGTPRPTPSPTPPLIVQHHRKDPT